MIKLLFKVFMIAGVLPIMLSTMAGSFILLDVSVLNPIYWSQSGRVASSLWLGFVLGVIVISACNVSD
jgi:zinc transporter ZupT